MSPEDREMMKLAIEEARRSTAEDAGPRPKVGVVVAMNGRILARAHRGEGGPGQHAEYVALERYLKDEFTTGAVVYTTLEPCTSRNPPKIACAQHLIERKVGKVWVGMLDPNPDIQGNGIQALRGAGIEVEMFPADLMNQIEEMNRVFRRNFPHPLSPERKRASKLGAEQPLQPTRVEPSDSMTERSYQVSLAKKQALRSYLQRAEVRLSTMHRIAGAFLSGAGLLLLLPLFLKDVLFAIVHTLANKWGTFSTLPYISPWVWLAVLCVPFLIALGIPLLALWYLLEDLALFYFSANIPRSTAPRGAVFHPRFALTAIPFADDDFEGAKEEIREVQFATDMRKFVIPFQDQEKNWLLELVDTKEGAIVALPDDRWIEAYRKAEDFNALRMAFGLAGAYNRPLVEEAAKSELSLIRHNLRLRRLVMRYMKALILFVWTAIISFGIVSLVGVTHIVHREQDIGDLLVISIGLLLWSSLAPMLVRAPVRWIYREYTADSKDDLRDRHLMSFERFVIYACLVASIVSCFAAIMLGGLEDWWFLMIGPVLPALAYARGRGKLSRIFPWI